MSLENCYNPAVPFDQRAVIHQIIKGKECLNHTVFQMCHSNLQIKYCYEKFVRIKTNETVYIHTKVGMLVSLL